MTQPSSNTEPDRNGRPSVLLVVAQPFFQWRGSPIRVAYNAAALAESGYAVDLLTLPIGDPLDIPGVRIHRVGNPLRRRAIPIGPSPAKAVFDLLLAWRGRQMVRAKRYAVIHGIEECGIIACWLARRGGARSVYEKHSDPASHRGGFVRNLALRLYAIIERFTIRHADLVIGTGPGLVDQAQRHGYTTPCRHIPDIPSSRHEADQAAIDRARHAWAPAPDTCLATYVGSFAAYQGIDLLFDAIPSCIRQNPHLQFLIVGGNAAQIAQRRTQLTTAGCAEAVTFAGLIPPDALPAVLAASDILLSPRVSGTNTPLKLLDYLKAGRAIVATDLPANRQILDDQNAVFVKPAAAALAKGIIALAADPERRTRLGQAGRERIRKQYTYDLFKAGLAAAYREIMPS